MPFEMVEAALLYVQQDTSKQFSAAVTNIFILRRALRLFLLKRFI